jgi:hypothetical protein
MARMRTTTVSRLFCPLGDFSAALLGEPNGRENPHAARRRLCQALLRVRMYPPGCKLCVDPMQGLLQTYRRFLRSTVLSTFFPGMFDV